MNDAAPLLRVDGLVKHFTVTAGFFSRAVGAVRAVDGVSFALGRRETLGLVGESGCGKTTLGRCVARLIEPTAGRIRFDGRELMALPPAEMRATRRDLQMIFQDPFSSLNPRMTVADIIGEALVVHRLAKRADAEARVGALLDRVGIPPAWMHRYPHEFSGGQRQRIGIARAIALEPKLIVCDEAVSALDVSIQAQILNLLIELREEMNLAYLFIAHDLSVVRHISDRIAVMYLGEVVESAPAEMLFRDALHPYTRALLEAVPVPDPRRRGRRAALQGDVPSPRNPPPGCRFHTRCPVAMDRCRHEVPGTTMLPEGREVKCFLVEGAGRQEGWRERVQVRIDDAEAHSAAERKPAPPLEMPLTPPAASRIEDEGPRLPRHSLSLAAGLLVLLFAVQAVRAPFARRAEAERQLAGLSREIVDATALRGAPPDSLDDLGWRLYEVFPQGRALDPWGHVWSYAPRRDGGFALVSAGPDGDFGGEDDIGSSAP